jgi:hypothetical protein
MAPSLDRKRGVRGGGGCIQGVAGQGRNGCAVRQTLLTLATGLLSYRVTELWWYVSHVCKPTQMQQHPVEQPLALPSPLPHVPSILAQPLRDAP